MKIVITGLAGFIGYHTAIHFHNNGHEVYGFDNFNTYYDPELKYDRSEDLRINYGILCPNLDLRDNKITEFLSSIRPDLVIHLAASAGVRVSLDQPLEYIDNNITATQKLINSLTNANVDVVWFNTSFSHATKSYRSKHKFENYRVVLLPGIPYKNHTGFRRLFSMMFFSFSFFMVKSSLRR